LKHSGTLCQHNLSLEFTCYQLPPSFALGASR